MCSLNVAGQKVKFPKEYDITNVNYEEGALLLFEGVPYTGKALKTYPTGELKEFIEFNKGLKSGESVEYYKNGALMSQGLYDNNQKHGKWEFWDEKGKLTYRGFYDHDVQNGKFYNRVDKAKRYWYEEFVNGLRHGEFTMFNFEDDTVQHGFYEYDYKSGPWLEWDTEKDTSVRKTYLTMEQKRASLPTTIDWKEITERPDGMFYYENVAYTGKRVQLADGKIGGQIKNEMLIENGKLVWNKAYHPNGQLLLDATFAEGKADGEWKYYREDGSLSRIENFKGGRKHGVTISYYQKGHKQIEEYYENGLLSGPSRSWKYYNKDYLEYDRNYLRDTLHGLSREFHSNGNIYQELEYHMGIPHGFQKTYDGQGRLIYKSTFDMAVKTGMWTYYTNGQLASEAEFSNGVMNGDYKEYYEDGKPKLNGQYKKGEKSGWWTSYYNHRSDIVHHVEYEKAEIISAYSEIDSLPTLYSYNGLDADLVKFLDQIRSLVTTTSMNGIEEIFADSIYIDHPDFTRAKSRKLSRIELLKDFEKRGTSDLFSHLSLAVGTGLKASEFEGNEGFWVNYCFADTSIERMFEEDLLVLPVFESIYMYKEPSSVKKHQVEIDAYPSKISTECVVGEDGACWYEVKYDGGTSYVLDVETTRESTKRAVLFGKENGSYKILGLF